LSSNIASGTAKPLSESCPTLAGYGNVGAHYKVIEIQSRLIDRNFNTNYFGVLEYYLDGKYYNGETLFLPPSSKSTTFNINVNSLSSGPHVLTVVMRGTGWKECFFKYKGDYANSPCRKCHTKGVVPNRIFGQFATNLLPNKGILSQTSINFTVNRKLPDKPTNQSPSKRFFTGSASATSISFKWDAVANATSYFVNIFDAISSKVVQQGSPTPPKFSTNSLLPLHRYSWNIAGVNSVGRGPFTDIYKFIIGPMMECWPEIGNANGNDIETCYVLNSTAEKFELRDITRRTNMNVVGRNGIGHNGHMSDSSSIMTKSYGMISPIKNDSNNWSQISAIDAHINTAKVYDYINSRFAYNDALNTESWASMVESEDPGNCPQNLAFYTPGVTPLTAQFCKGTSSSSNLDIVSHEWSHAVTALASHGTLTKREAGALNEAFSDWMAIAIKHANNDTSWTVNISSTSSRNLADPSLSKPVALPSLYKGTHWGFCEPSEEPSVKNDYCWVHHNSGVPNKMFYLLAQAIGVEKAIQIAYRANIKYWVPDLTFLEARQGMIVAAKELYGSSSPEISQVQKAWDAVGVTPPSTP